MQGCNTVESRSILSNKESPLQHHRIVKLIHTMASRMKKIIPCSAMVSLVKSDVGFPLPVLCNTQLAAYSKPESGRTGLCYTFLVSSPVQLKLSIISVRGSWVLRVTVKFVLPPLHLNRNQTREKDWEKKVSSPPAPLDFSSCNVCKHQSDRELKETRDHASRTTLTGLTVMTLQKSDFQRQCTVVYPIIQRYVEEYSNISDTLQTYGKIHIATLAKNDKYPQGFKVLFLSNQNVRKSSFHHCWLKPRN